MKRFRSIMLAVASLVAVAVFTSCDDDMEAATDLDGIWQGTIQGKYYQDRYKLEGQWDTEIQFNQNLFSRKGTGTEVDFYYGDRHARKSKFDWQVKDGCIYLTYKDGYRVVIRDYDLYSTGSVRRFRGYFDDINGNELAQFNLIKIADWSDNYY